MQFSNFACESSINFPQRRDMDYFWLHSQRWAFSKKCLHRPLIVCPCPLILVWRTKFKELCLAIKYLFKFKISFLLQAFYWLFDYFFLAVRDPEGVDLFSFYLEVWVVLEFWKCFPMILLHIFSLNSYIFCFRKNADFDEFLVYSAYPKKKPYI